MGRFLCKSNPCFDFNCFIFYISLLGLAARWKNWRLEFYREFFGCLGVREYSKLRKVTVPWQKRLTSARRGLERGEEAAEFIHGTRRLVSMLMTRRGSFVDFSVMNEWKEWRGRRRRLSITPRYIIAPGRDRPPHYRRWMVKVCELRGENRMK